MSTEANKAIIRRYIEQLNRRNEAVVDELITEDFTADTLHAISVDDSGPSVGRDVVRQGYRRNTTAFPDHQVTAEHLIAEGGHGRDALDASRHPHGGLPGCPRDRP